MTRSVLLLVIISCIYVYTVHGQSNKPGWRLIWNDEFDGNSIDRTKWDHEVDCWGGGNNERQCYTNRATNSYVSNGNLYLTAKRERYTGSQNGCTATQGCTNTMDYTSARLRTRNSPTGSWKYGRFEIRAKLPKGDFLWPAIWMLPTDWVYGNWAASGEIDIMEARGQETRVTSSALHYGGVWPNNRYITTGKKTYNFDFSQDFHVFSLEWEEQEIRIYVDDTLQWTVDLNRNWYAGVGPNPYTKNGQPWDQRMHLIMNVAVGGGFFGPEYGQMTSNSANTWTSPSLVVDYVRVYTRDTNVVTTGPNSTTGLPSTTDSSGCCPCATTTSVSPPTTGRYSTTTTGGCNCPNSAQPEFLANENGNYAVNPSSQTIGGSLSSSTENFLIGAAMTGLALLVVAVVLIVVLVVKTFSLVRVNNQPTADIAMTTQ